jgi:putative ABC transport system permease protein
MFRTALRNVLAHKARLLMTVLAVMLGVAFVSGTLVFTNTISDAFQKSSAKGFDQVDVAIQAESAQDEGDKLGKDPKLTQALLDKAAKAPGAESAIGVVTGFTAIADKDGKLIGGGFQSQGGNYWGDKDPRYPLNSGKAPTGKNEVAIDAETAKRAGYKVGDTIRISIDGPVLTPTITAVFTTDDGNVAAGGSLALFDTATAQQLFHMTGTYDEIDVKAAQGTSQTALQRTSTRSSRRTPPTPRRASSSPTTRPP